MVAPRAEARVQYERLSTLLDTLGPKMNPSKKTPPCETLTCFGIQVDIVECTLSKAPDKFWSFYREFCQLAAKNHYLESLANL